MLDMIVAAGVGGIQILLVSARAFYMCQANRSSLWDTVDDWSDFDFCETCRLTAMDTDTPPGGGREVGFYD